MLLGNSTGMPSTVSKARAQSLQRSGSPATRPRQSGHARPTVGGGLETSGTSDRVVGGARRRTSILTAVPHPYSRGQHNGRTAAAPRRKVVLVLEDHASVGGLI